jgi:hypothetical protein
MGVNLAPFSKGIAAATVGVSSFASSVNAIGAGATSGMGAATRGVTLLGLSLVSTGAAAAGLLSVIAGSALVSMGRGLLDSADAANDMANEIGTTAGTLQELRYAAKLTGSETETLDAALLKMSQNLGDAAIAGGPASQTLGRLGLDAARLAQMDPGEAFRAIATEISAIDNPAAQASVAVDLFGKAGAKLLNTLRAAPEDINRLTREARDLGIALGGDELEAIGATNDAIDRLGYAAQGLGTTIVSRLAPSITAGIDVVRGWVASLTTGEGVIGSVAHSIVDALGTMGSTLGQVATDIAAQFAGPLATMFGDLWVRVSGFASGIAGELAPGLASIASAGGELGSALLGLVQPALAAISEILTGTVYPAIAWVGSGIASLIQDFSTWIGVTREGQGVIEGWSQTIAVGIQKAAAFVRNFASYWKIAQLSATQALGNVFAFLDTLPENFSRITAWIGRNWTKLLSDLAQGAKVGLLNIGENIGRFGTAILDALQGKGFHFEFKPLLQGFQATAEALPTMLEPAWVDLSQEMGQEFDKIAANELQRLDQIGSKANQIATGAKANQIATGAKASSASQVSPASLGPDPSKPFASLATLGSKEAYSSIIRHQFGGRDDQPLKEVAKVARQQLEVSREQLAETRKQSSGGTTVGVFKMA